MLLSLPEEMVAEIFQGLSVDNLANIMSVNKQCYRIAKDKRQWLNHAGFPQRMPSTFVKPTTDACFSCSIEPPPRLCQSSSVHGDYLYVQGGHNTAPSTQLFQEVMDDCWRYSFVERKWEQIVATFPKRTEHSTVVWGDKLWIFGGFGGSSFSNDVHSFDFATKTVTQVTTTGAEPSPRSAHVAVVKNGKMYVFGGWNGTEQNNDMFCLDLATLHWTQVSYRGNVVPAGRCSHAAAVSSRYNACYVYGGYGGPNVNYLKDVLRFDFDTLTWSKLGDLQPRSRMKMVEYRNKLYVYGGWDSQLHFSTFYEFNIDTGESRDVSSNFGCDGAKLGQYSMVVSNKMLYIFGGYSDKLGTSTNDLTAYRLGHPGMNDDAMEWDDEL